MTDHTDLIRRIEEAPEGSRELDAEVHTALGKAWTLGKKTGYRELIWDGDDMRPGGPLPRYSSVLRVETLAILKAKAGYVLGHFDRDLLDRGLPATQLRMIRNLIAAAITAERAACAKAARNYDGFGVGAAAWPERIAKLIEARDDTGDGK